MKRLENGLIEDLKYVKDESTGRINWLKTIPEEYLYINQDKKSAIEKRLDKPFNEVQIGEVKDTELILTLQGVRWLLDARGYKNIKTKIDVATPEYAAATCEITFLPNEEENMEQTFSSSASAHAGNTKSFYKNYLVEAASNRALCRACRNYLRINVVSKEELSDASLVEEEPSKPSAFPQPIVMLEKAMKEKNISFDKLKELYKEKSADWKELKDIDKVTILAIAGRIKKEF